MELHRFLADSWTGLQSEDVLTAPVTALMGVSDEAAGVLSRLGIVNVFDLGHSALFGLARSITHDEELTSVYRLHGRVPGDLVDAADASPEALALSSPTVLRGIGSKLGDAIADKLGLRTLREMGSWPPYTAARGIGLSLLQPDGDPGPDPEAPADLLPSNGLHPTERFTYTALVLDGAKTFAEDSDGRPAGATAGQKGRSSSKKAAGWRPPYSAKDLLRGASLSVSSADPVRPPVAQGAVLTWSHSWRGAGLALGQLLHSVALAPGESTRIAVIDWSRRTTASTREAIDQDEWLRNRMDRTRAIGEVHSAIAREVQRGSSGSGSEAFSWETGVAAWSPVMALSDGEAFSTSKSWGWSTSSGTRSLTNSMSQRIQDAAQQAASSSRSRRASVIREASTEEREVVTTRAITNYNHMHALTVQYYEVVQVQRTTLTLQNAERCLFVPIEPLDFSDPALVRRFRGALAEAALLPSVRQALVAHPDEVILEAPMLSSDQGAPWDAVSTATAARQLRYQVGSGAGGRVHLPADVIFDPAAAQIEFASHDHSAVYRWVVAERRTGELIHLQSDNYSTSWPMEAERPQPVRLADLRWFEITAVSDADEEDYADREMPKVLSYRLPLRAGNDQFWLTVGGDFGDPNGATKLRLGVTNSAHVHADLRDHLQANVEHYTAAVWQSMSGAQIAGLLAGVELDGVPLIRVVDPTPVAVAGPYVVLRMPLRTDGERAEWQQFLERNDIRIGQQSTDVVPLPTGGVFAEAVQGRFNSAERIDLTRFWNWQDSPIPVVATDIAPVAVGGRTAEAPLSPGKLEAAIVQQAQPMAVPDPNFAAALAVLGQGSLFRDMSGLAQTTALAQAALGATSAGAGRAAGQAGENFAAGAELVGKLAGAALGLPAAPGGGRQRPPSAPNTVTNQGGTLVRARELDQAETAARAERSSGEGVPPPPPVQRRQEQVLRIDEPPTPTTVPPPPAPTPRPKPVAAKERTLVLQSTLPGTSTPVHGVYDVGVVLPGVQSTQTNNVFTIKTGDALPATTVSIPPGTWAVYGRAQPEVPQVIRTVPAATVPLLGPIDVTVAQTVQGQHIFDFAGTVDVPPNAKTVHLRLEPVITVDKIEKKVSLSASGTASAGVEAEVSASIESEVSAFLAGAKASGGLAIGSNYTVSGTLEAGTEVVYTVTFERIVGFRIQAS